MQIYKVHLSRTIRQFKKTDKLKKFGEPGIEKTQYASAKYIEICSWLRQEIVAFNYRQALLHCQLFYPNWTPMCIGYIGEHQQ